MKYEADKICPKKFSSGGGSHNDVIYGGYLAGEAVPSRPPVVLVVVCLQSPAPLPVVFFDFWGWFCEDGGWTSMLWAKASSWDDKANNWLSLGSERIEYLVVDPRFPPPPLGAPPAPALPTGALGPPEPAVLPVEVIFFFLQYDRVQSCLKKLLSLFLAEATSYLSVIEPEKQWKKKSQKSKLESKATKMKDTGMSWLEPVQDFWTKLDIKPLMHLLEISNF